MVNQKLISFKVDSDQLVLLDSILPELGVNRNKFINRCLSFCLSAVVLQIDVCKKRGISLKNVPFLS